MRETFEQVVVLGRESSFFSARMAPSAGLAALRGMVTARLAPADSRLQDGLGCVTVR